MSLYIQQILFLFKMNANLREQELMASFRPDLQAKTFIAPTHGRQQRNINSHSQQPQSSHVVSSYPPHHYPPPPIHLNQPAHHSAHQIPPTRTNYFITAPHNASHDQAGSTPNRSPITNKQQYIKLSNGQSHLRINNVPSQTNMLGQSHVHVRRNSPPIIFHYNAMKAMQNAGFIVVQPQRIVHPQHIVYPLPNLPPPQQIITTTTTTTVTVWEKRYFQITTQFQTYFQHYELILRQIRQLSQQFDAVASQQQWLQLKQRHDALVQRMTKIKVQMLQILQENRQFADRQEGKEQGSTEEVKEDQTVWEARYKSLLEQYQSMAQHYTQLQNSSLAVQNQSEQHQQLIIINEKYTQLEDQYNHVVGILQQRQTEHGQQNQNGHTYEDLTAYSKNLQEYILQLEAENNKLVSQIKKSTDGFRGSNSEEWTARLSEKQQEIQRLQRHVLELEAQIQSKPTTINTNQQSKQQITELQTQIHQMELYCRETKLTFEMKDFQIKQLNDKTTYLQEELKKKNQEIERISKIFNEKLIKIQNEISQKNAKPTIIADSNDDQIQRQLIEAQKSISLKHTEVRRLQQKINEMEYQIRRISQQKNNIDREWEYKIEDIHDDYKRKFVDKEYQIKGLQRKIEQLQEIKAKQKEFIFRQTQLQLQKYTEQKQTRQIQIKTMKQTIIRMQHQIRQRNTQLSRVRTPSMKSHSLIHSQANATDQRYEQELKMMNDQLERRNEEISKLKKERDQRSKEFKELQDDFDNLQDDNNKKRLEINSLKRQLGDMSNLELELQNVKSSLQKKSMENNQLKNNMYERDRLKMELDQKQKQLERMHQNWKLKSKQTDILSDRAYELEQKLRQNELRSQPREDFNTISKLTYTQDLSRVQEALRKKQTQVLRIGTELQEAIRLKNDVQGQLVDVQQKHTIRVKGIQIQLLQARNKLAIGQKKQIDIQNSFKQLTQTHKKCKSLAEDDLSRELARQKEHFDKQLARTDEQSKILREKLKKYQSQFNEYQLEFQTIKNKNKEAEIHKVQTHRRIKQLTEKIEEKELELKNFKSKEGLDQATLKGKDSKINQLSNQLKAKQFQLNQLKTKTQELKTKNKNLKKEYEKYRFSIQQNEQVTNNIQIQNLTKRMADENYTSEQDLGFRIKDKHANQIFQNKVIYLLKAENDQLRRELQGRGISLEVDKMRVRQIEKDTLIRSKHLLKKEEGHFTEQANFYREKNKELEQRVNSHIQVNKDLKERIELLIKQQTQTEEINFYKTQVREFQAIIDELNSKLNKLIEQNKLIKNKLNASESANSQLQSNQFIIQELNRKISQLTLQSNRASNTHEKQKRQKDDLQLKINEYEKSITKLTNQISLLKSQNERLSQIIKTNKKDNQSAADLSIFKAKIQELSALLREQRLKVDEYSHKNESLSLQNHKLQTQIKHFDQQINELKQSFTSTSVNQQQIYQLRGKIQQLQHSLQIISMKYQHSEEEILFYREKLAQAQSQTPNLDGLVYELQKIRNELIELDALLNQLNVKDQRSSLVKQQMEGRIAESLKGCGVLLNMI